MKEDAQYQVPCVFGKGTAQEVAITVPGSKSVTNRALLLAALSEGRSVLRGALFSDDSRCFLRALQELGFDAGSDESEKTMYVDGFGGDVPKCEASVYVGSAGTAARFLSAWLGISHGTYHLDASPQMRRRPMAPLLSCLRELGCEVSCHGDEGFFPFTLHADGFQKNQISVDVGDSSQFLSALLIAAGISKEDFEIQVRGTHGMSYIRMTERMMGQFGVHVERPREDRFRIAGGQSYRSQDYQIEPDASAACYFYAMALLLGITVQVAHVHFGSLQGDVEFLRVLEQMGARVTEHPDGIQVSGPPDGQFRGVTADLSACSDQAITLAALAPFATTPTRIQHVGHIRLQESDRMAGIANELTRLGIPCQIDGDDITIEPGTPKPGLVKTYEDHRMAMGFSLIGLRAPGIVIDNPGCCKKTFENYFETLEEFLGKYAGAR